MEAPIGNIAVVCRRSPGSFFFDSHDVSPVIHNIILSHSLRVLFGAMQLASKLSALF